MKKSKKSSSRNPTQKKGTPGFQSAGRSSGKLPSNKSLGESNSVGNVTFSNKMSSIGRKKSVPKAQEGTPSVHEMRTRSLGKSQISQTYETKSLKKPKRKGTETIDRRSSKESRSKDRDRRSRSHSKKEHHLRLQEMQKQQELRKQIAVKEMQLAKMTETAHKLRQKIQSAQPFSVRGSSENLNPNKDTMINNTKSESRDGQRGSLLRMSSKASGAGQISRREKDILKGMSKKNSVQSPYSKSPAAGGGMRSQYATNMVFQQRQLSSIVPPQEYVNLMSTDITNAYHSSPLRQKTSAGGRSQPRTAYTSIPQSQPYASYQTVDVDSRPAVDHRRLQTIDNRRASPLRRSKSPVAGSNSRSPHSYDRIPVREPETIQVRHGYARLPPPDVRMMPAPVAPPEPPYALMATDKLNIQLRERVSSMTFDIQSMQRRLDLVEQERMRVCQERDGLDRRLRDAQIEVRRVETQLSTDGAIEKQNSMVQDEIRWQRDLNNKTQSDINGIDQRTKEVDIQMHATIQECKLSSTRNEDDQLQILTVHNQVESLAQQHGRVNRDVDSILANMDTQKQQENQVDMDKMELETRIARLQSERNKLIEDLGFGQTQQSTDTREMTYQKNQLINENKVQTKFLTAKIFANMFHRMNHYRLAESFKEIKLYSAFDQDCSQKLRALSMIFHRLALHKEQVALSKWYDNTLKPYDQINQNQDILANMHHKNIKLNVLNIFRNHVLARRQVYMGKNDGVRKVWECLQKAKNMELKRAVNIWQQLNNQVNVKNRRIRQLIWKRYVAKLRQPFLIWQMVSFEVGVECKTVMMRRYYFQQIFTTTIFQNLRQATLMTKKVRIIRQGMIFNAWRKYIQLKRHTLSQNVSVFKFRQAYQKYIIRVCFDALHFNKQKRAQKLINIALRDNMDIALQDFEKFTRDYSNKIEMKNQMRACQVFRNMWGAQLKSYFKHWAQHTLYKRNLMITKINDRFMNLYRNMQLNTFLKWRRQALRSSQGLMSQNLQSLESKGKHVEKLNIVDDQQHLDNVVANLSQGEFKGLKCYRKYKLRYCQVALYRWKERVRHIGYTKERHGSVHNKLRMRFLSDAFGRYKLFLFKCRQHDRNLISADHLIATFNTRSLRRCFNGFCTFSHFFRKQRNYCGRILLRMVLWKKRRAFTTWIKNGDVKFTYDLEQKQNYLIKYIERLKIEIAELEKQHELVLKYLRQINAQMTRKAHKQLGNFMVRNTGDTLQQSYKKWKILATSIERRKLYYISIINHWRKYQFDYTRNCLKTFIHQGKMDVKRDCLKQNHIQQNELHQIMSHGNERMEGKRKEAQIAIYRAQAVQQFKKKRLNKAITVMTRRNFDQDFYSKKRLIFCVWRHTVKTQKAFLLCVKTVLEKSMLMKGYHYIQERSRVDKRDTMVYNLCHKFFQAFQRNHYAELFHRWKQGNLISVLSNSKDVAEKQAVEDNRMSNLVDRIKHMNTSNVEHFIVKRWKQKIFKAWVHRNFVQDQFLIKSKEATEILKAAQCKRAIQKWFMRVETTKRIRMNYKTMRDNKDVRLRIMAWEVLCFRRGAAQDLTKTLSNLERLLRDKVVYQDGFKCIKSYAQSKKTASILNKRRSTHDAVSYLSHINEIRTKRYMEMFKNSVWQKRTRAKMTRQIMLKVDNVNLRDAFRRYARFMQMEVFAQDMNEVGPQTEHVFEAKRLMVNLVDFMRAEHFTEEEIVGLRKKARDHNIRLLSTSILRFKAGKEKKEAIKCMEHWKMWIAVKKMFKYYIEFGNAQVTYGKCDMRWAFSKWRRSDEVVAGGLRKMKYTILTNLNNEQTKVLEKQAMQEAENSTVINHMNVQRDELLENFIKSQQLSLSTLHENHIKGKRQGFNRWKRLVRDEKLQEFNEEIRVKVENIAELKDTEKRIEVDNVQLSKENDELRKFSMDGFIIAKNVQQLSEDRETLSIDLADKTDQIRNLLMLNKALKQDLAKLGYEPHENIHTKLGLGKGIRIKAQSPTRQ